MKYTYPSCLYILTILLFILYNNQPVFSQSNTSCKKRCQLKYTVPAILPQEPLHQGEELVLVLNEEFTDTVLNRDLWMPHPPFNLVAPMNVCNTEKNIRISGGTAKMYMRYEPQYCDYYNYDSLGRFFMDSLYTYFTCGSIWSNLRYPEGKFEIRCKIPADPEGQYWPAFWLYGVCGVEIDAFEFMDERKKPGPKSRATKNLLLSWHVNSECNPECWCRHGERYRDKIDYAAGFHTYTVSWDKAGIKWYVDGKLRRWQSFYAVGKRPADINEGTAHTKPYTTLPAKIDKPMRIIASNGIHSYYVENKIPIEESVLEIDYIKAWAWVNTKDTLRLCNYHYQDEINPTLIAAGTVIISGKGCRDRLEGRNIVSVFTTGNLIISPEFKKENETRLLHYQVDSLGNYILQKKY